MTAPLVMPSKPSTYGAARANTQASRRFTDTVFDQHKHSVLFPRGRPFCGQREYPATPDKGHQAGFLTPDLQCGEYVFSTVTPEGDRLQSVQDRAESLASAWSAPWLPLAKYAKYDYFRMRVIWQYDRLEADENRALDLFWEAAAKLGGESDVVDPERPDKVPFRIRSVLGTPYAQIHMIRLAQAARAEDPWLLGFTNTPNEALAKCLGKTVRWLGGNSDKRLGDHKHIITDLPATPAPIVTAEAVLATAPHDLAAMIADAIEKHEAKKKAENVAKMAKARAAKGKKPARVSGASV